VKHSKLLLKHANSRSDKNPNSVFLIIFHVMLCHWCCDLTAIVLMVSALILIAYEMLKGLF